MKLVPNKKSPNTKAVGSYAGRKHIRDASKIGGKKTQKVRTKKRVAKTVKSK